MNNKKSTKRALLSSVLSLVLCMAMLIGTTFAWFTDSVTSGSNIIKSGKLEVALVDAQGASLEGEMIEWAAKDGRAQNEILWEPGCTYNTEEFYIENTGNLNLKFKFAVTGIDGDAKLLEVLDFKVDAKAEWFNFNTGAVSVSPAAGTTFDLLKGCEINTFFYGVRTFNEYVLEPGDKVGPMVLTGHMDEEAGNEYQNLTVNGVAVSILASQATGEEDSFSGTYDELASYAGTGYGRLEEGATAVEIPIRNEDEAKVGSVVIPADAVDPNADKQEATIKESTYKANIKVAAGSETKAFEISVEGLKENNTTPVKVEVRMPAGLDPATFKLYHYDEEIECTYNPSTGYVTFESATFSPFTIEYDAESVYDAPSGDESQLPKASVVNSPEYENTDLAWGSYGAWSPTEGLNSQLEAAYTFACTETLDEAKANPYANWYCDFYVKLSEDLGANEIFLGGNYGSFGWVGFHNGDLTLDANTEIPLLGSVTTNPWTYLDVVQNVGTFICGVGDVNDALSGATFTVTLRLTNPSDTTEYYDIAPINYTFK